MKKSVRAALAAILMLALTLGLLAPLAHASEAEPYRAALNNYGIHAEAAWDAGLTGEGVTVAVIDTGLNPGNLYGPRNITAGRHYYWRLKEDGRCFPDGKRYGYYSNRDTGDQVGHGTAVAGIIADIAPGAIIMPIRCFDAMESDAYGCNSIIISAIDYAVENGADVINLSMGLKDVSVGSVLAILRAIDAGCIVVAAAGNYGDETVLFPAAFSNVIGVGAIDKEGRLAAFSSRGVNVCAIGEDVLSCGWTSYTSQAKGSGTSYSAAVVSGSAALVKDLRPDMTQDEFMELLEATCDPVMGEDGKPEPLAGAGTLNLERLMLAALWRWRGPVCESYIQAAWASVDDRLKRRCVTE